MTRSKETIAIVMGGTSQEKDISLKSADNIYHHIDKGKYNAYKVLCIEENHFQVIQDYQKIPIDNNTFSFSLKDKKISFDKVFMIIHGDPGENGKLSTYFKEKKIPYTSSHETSSNLTFNKFKCNIYLHSKGYIVPQAQSYKSFNNIKYPCIVKPSCSGSSFGISKVYKEENLQHAISLAKQHDDEVIIEDFINGREITCAVFNNKNNIETLPLTEIISQNDIFDYDAKYNGKSIEKTPAKIESNIEAEIKKISKNLYIELKLRGIVRIDFIINNNTPYIIEINTIPGLSKKSIVPQMLKCANISIKDFITVQLDNITQHPD